MKKIFLVVVAIVSVFVLTQFFNSWYLSKTFKVPTEENLSLNGKIKVNQQKYMQYIANKILKPEYKLKNAKRLQKGNVLGANIFIGDFTLIKKNGEIINKKKKEFFVIIQKSEDSPIDYIELGPDFKEIAKGKDFTIYTVIPVNGDKNPKPPAI